MNMKNAIIKASGHFLTEHLPENWQDMTEEDINQFMKDHTWERLEGVDLDEVWGHIEILAMDFKNCS
jgi:hypothetical protein